MKSLRNSIYALGVAGLSLLPIKSEAGTLAGKVTDMFSNSPYSNINVTLVNDSGDVYETTTGLPPTAVEPNSWGMIKRSFNLPIRSPKTMALEQALDGTYALDLPDGVYTLAFTDGKIAVAKPTPQDLFNLQFDANKRTVPRALKVRVNGNTQYDETLLPKDFDLEFAWVVMSGIIEKYNPENMNFYVYTGPSRKKHREDPNGKEPSGEQVELAIEAIKDYGKVRGFNPKISTSKEFPEYIPKPADIGSGVGMMVPRGTALFFWDSGLNPGIAGTGIPFVDKEGNIVSSLAQYSPSLYSGSTALNEVLGTAGLHGEPGTNYDLDRRIRDTGGSIFLDIMTGDVNVDEITPRDTQIITYHGIRPIGTRAPDITERVVNE